MKFIITVSYTERVILSEGEGRDVVYVCRCLKEQTWKTIETVWKDTSSSEVARAFVLAYRIMRLIIEENGNNSWLAHGTPHCDVRQDYANTETGIKPKHTKHADL
jgi:hypothetical protein